MGKNRSSNTARSHAANNLLLQPSQTNKPLHARKSPHRWRRYCHVRDCTKWLIFCQPSRYPRCGLLPPPPPPNASVAKAITIPITTSISSGIMIGAKNKNATASPTPMLPSIPFMTGSFLMRPPTQTTIITEVQDIVKQTTIVPAFTKPLSAADAENGNEK